MIREHSKSTSFFTLALTFFAALVAHITAPAAHAQLNSQEQSLAARMINASGQQRPSLTLSPILARVARARAADLAKRDYFAHTNPDGHAANYLVRRAGYELPSWYGTNATANNIESITGGYTTAETAWKSFMDSSPHRTHLLAQNSFYAAQTYYGVGYYYDAESTYKHYWVVLTAPPPAAPKLAITSPAVSARLIAPSVSVAGTTSDESGTAIVEARLENASGTGSYQPASGTDSWSATLSGLTPGANTIRVRSKTANGSVIAELTRAVSYVETGSLTVIVSGSGSVTAGFAGVTLREVGKNVTLTAKPAAGHLFTGWSGDVASSKPAITFTMRDGLQIEAGFIPNPFIPLQGSYAGLVTSGTQSGFIQATATTTGVVTGRITLAGLAYSFKGRFDLDGVAIVTIPRKNQTPLTLSLQLDVAGGTQRITGTISDGTLTANVSADRATFDARSNPAPQAGRYTVVLTPNPSVTGTASPQGDGFAALVVSTAGRATVSGRLADGTTFSQGSIVSKDGNLPLYLGLSRAPVGSTATGTLTFRDTSASDLDGSISWTKTPRATDRFYPTGFATKLPTVGARYTSPKSGTTALGAVQSLPNATAGLGDGNLDQPITVATAVTSSNKVVMATPGDPNLTVKISPTNGLFSGTFKHPADNVRRAVRGVVLQKQNAAFGFFPGIDRSGYFSLATDGGN